MDVDPVTGAALLSASLFARKALEQAGSAAGEALSTAAGRLVTWLRRIGSKNADVASALKMVETAPEDLARVELLGRIVADYVGGSDVLRQQLLALAEDCQSESNVTTFGGAHIHGDISGGTITQYGGDHIELHHD